MSRTFTILMAAFFLLVLASLLGAPKDGRFLPRGQARADQTRTAAATSDGSFAPSTWYAASR